jgi:OPA family sugar phosphate sensor protein UhpC-like MFS transporter
VSETAPALTPAAAPAPMAGWRARVFAASWLSYFSYYFTRKNFSVAKKPMARELGLSKSDLQWIDLASLTAYAAGQFVHGVLGDAIGPRRLVALGMLTTAALSALFGVSSLLGVFVLLWGLNGFVQATGWPGNGKLMASWWSARDRGPVMGWWSTCYQAGGLAATFVAGWLLVWGWRAAFLGPALWVAVVGGAFWLLVRDRPSDVGLPDPEVARGVTAEERARLRREAWPLVLRNPRTWSLGLAYFCLKMIRYAFLYWLPFYLAEGYGYGDQKSAYVSMGFEAGGVPLVVLAAWAADRVFGRRRIGVAAAACVCLAGALALYKVIGGHGVAWNVIGLGLIGGTLFAADTLVSGSASQDLGGPHAAGLACGVINGIGSIGAIVQGFVTVAVSDAYGWDALFTVFMVLAAAAALALAPFARVRPHPPGEG